LYYIAFYTVSSPGNSKAPTPSKFGGKGIVISQGCVISNQFCEDCTGFLFSLQYSPILSLMDKVLSIYKVSLV